MKNAVLNEEASLIEGVVMFRRVGSKGEEEEQRIVELCQCGCGTVRTPNHWYDLRSSMGQSRWTSVT